MLLIASSKESLLDFPELRLLQVHVLWQMRPFSRPSSVPVYPSSPTTHLQVVGHNRLSSMSLTARYPRPPFMIHAPASLACPAPASSMDPLIRDQETEQRDNRISTVDSPTMNGLDLPFLLLAKKKKKKKKHKHCGVVPPAKTYPEGSRRGPQLPSSQQTKPVQRFGSPSFPYPVPVAPLALAFNLDLDPLSRIQMTYDLKSNRSDPTLPHMIHRSWSWRS